MADVSVEIPGIGQVNAVNAATESTLQEILKAMKKGGGLGGGGGAGGGGVGGAAGKAGKELGKFEKEVAESTTAIDDMGKAAVYAEQMMQNLVLGGIGAAIGGIGALVVAAAAFGGPAALADDTLKPIGFSAAGRADMVS